MRLGLAGVVSWGGLRPVKAREIVAGKVCLGKDRQGRHGKFRQARYGKAGQDKDWQGLARQAWRKRQKEVISNDLQMEIARADTG